MNKLNWIKLNWIVSCQDFARRVVLQSWKDSHEDLLLKSGLPLLSKRRKITTLCHLYKIVHNLCSSPNPYQPHPRSTLRTLNSFVLDPPFCRLTFSGVATMFGAHGQRTLRGPFAYFITLFLWPLPHIHPYSDFAHVYLYYMILNTALFNQYPWLNGVFCKFGPFWWRDGGNGPLDDAMINGTLDNVMGN